MIRPVVHFAVFVGLIGLQISVPVIYKLSQSTLESQSDTQPIHYYDYNVSSAFAISEFVKLTFSLALIIWSAYQSINQSTYRKSVVLYQHTDSGLDTDGPEESPRNESINQSINSPMSQSPSEIDTDVEAPMVRKLTDHQSHDYSANQSINQSTDHSDSTSLLNKAPTVQPVNQSTDESENNAFFSLLHQIFRHEMTRSPVNLSTSQPINQSTGQSAYRTLFSLFILSLVIQLVNQLTLYLILIVNPATILLFKCLSQSVYQSINPSVNPLNHPTVNQSKGQSLNQQHMSALTLQVLGLALAQYHLFNQSVSQSVDQQNDQSIDQSINQVMVYLMLGSLALLTAFQSVMTEKNQKQLSSNQWINQSINHTVNQHCYQSINQSCLTNHVQNVVLHTFGIVINLSIYFFAPSVNQLGDKISFFDGLISQSVDQSISWFVWAVVFVHCLIGIFLFCVFKLFQPSPQLNQSINQSNFQSVSQSKLLASFCAVVLLLVVDQRFLSINQSINLSFINLIGVVVLFIGIFQHCTVNSQSANLSDQSFGQISQSSNGLSIHLNDHSTSYANQPIDHSNKQSVISILLTIALLSAVGGYLIVHPLDHTSHASDNQSINQPVRERAGSSDSTVQCIHSDDTLPPSINPLSGKRGRVAVVYSGAVRSFSAVFHSHLINLFAPSPFAVDIFMHINTHHLDEIQTKYLRANKNHAPIHPDQSTSQSVNRTQAQYLQQLNDYELFYGINQSFDPPVDQSINQYPDAQTVNATLDYMRYYRNLDNELIDLHQQVKYYEIDNTNHPAANLLINPANNKTWPFDKEYLPVFDWLTSTAQSGSSLNDALSALSSLNRASEAMYKYASDHSIDYQLIIRVRYDYFLKSNVWMNLFDLSVHDPSVHQSIHPSTNRTLELDDIVQGKTDTMSDEQNEQAIKQNFTDLSIDVSNSQQAIIPSIDHSGIRWDMFSSPPLTYRLHDMSYTSKLNRTSWYVPHCEHFGGSNDQFLVAPAWSYSFYSRRAQDLEIVQHVKAEHEKTRSNWLFQVERFVKSIADLNAIAVRGLPMCYGVMRMAQLDQTIPMMDQINHRSNQNLYVYQPTRCSFRDFGPNRHELGKDCCTHHCTQIQHMQNRIHHQIKKSINQQQLKIMIDLQYGMKHIIIPANNHTTNVTIKQFVLPNSTHSTITLDSYLHSFPSHLNLSLYQSNYYYYYMHGDPLIAVGCTSDRWGDPIDPYSVHVKATSQLMPFLVWQHSKRSRFELTKACAYTERGEE